MNLVKNVSFSLVALVYVGCGGSTPGENKETPDIATAYTIKVVDDAVIGANVESLGCTDVKELDNGKYSFKCPSAPKYISAKAGFVDVNKNGTHDSNEVSMGLPLLVNLNDDIFDVNLSDISVTPLTTLVANVTDKKDLVALANKLGISEKDFLKDISEDRSELFQKINALLIIAEASGITDQLLLMKKLRESIVNTTATDISNIFSEALENLKSDAELKKAYGEVFISGFINESQTFMNKTNVLIDLSREYSDNDARKIYITGFIYDAIIANADIKILDGDTIVGEVKSSNAGKWKIAISESVLAEDKVLIFTGNAIDNNGDKIFLKSAISTEKLRDLAKKRISVADSIDLVISNVTTAQVAILQKNDKDFASKPKELEEAKNKIEIFEQELLLKASSAIKAIIDGESRIEATENTFSFIFNNLVLKSENELELNLDGKISDVALKEQSDKIKNDAILSKQLLSIESDKSLVPLLDKSLYTIEYSGTPLTKKYKKTVISNTKMIEKSYTLESGVWRNTTTVEYGGKIINNLFYFDDVSHAPFAISLKEEKTVHSTELNKDYTFNILGKQLYLPFNDEDTSKVAVTIYVSSFDIVNMFHDTDNNKIATALGDDYVNLTVEEQRLALNRYIIAKVSEVPEPFNRADTKLNDAIQVAENVNVETDDIGAKLTNIKNILNNAEVADKDAQVGKALISLSEITNSDQVGDLIQLDLDGTVISTSENLESLIDPNKKMNVQLVNNIVDLSGKSMEVVHDTVLKLQDINQTLGENFADESYVFNYKDVNLTNNQSKLLRATILLSASQLEYITAFNTVTFDDVKTRTTVYNGITAEYQNISADPLSVFSRSDVGSLSTERGAERLSNAKTLFLEALDVLESVVATKESNVKVVENILE
ncbi:MAG TPA: hypothetical protein ENK66_06590, partial [Arcobacter sp.]|nr:hypothetical protein [Arcobacter sp.]